jgi:hypothetical protein
MRSQIAWTPRQYHKDGLERYCSHACGHDCTFNDYVKAQKAAKRLAQRLGRPFKPHVWENMGWHFCANITNSESAVYKSHNKYWASIFFNGRQFQGEHRNPSVAFKMALAVAHRVGDELRALERRLERRP